MPAPGFVSFALPKPVVERIDAALAADGTFRNRSEFVKHAVLRALETAQASAEA